MLVVDSSTSPAAAEDEYWDHDLVGLRAETGPQSSAPWLMRYTKATKTATANRIISSSPNPPRRRYTTAQG